MIGGLIWIAIAIGLTVFNIVRTIKIKKQIQKETQEMLELRNHLLYNQLPGRWL